MRAQTEEAYKLLVDSAVTLSQVSANGIRVDEPYLDRTIDYTKREISALRSEMEGSSFWASWKRHFGSNANLDSRDQLKVVLKTEGVQLTQTTEKGGLKLDVEVLDKIDHPFIRLYSQYLKLDKLQGTYLRGIKSQLCRGYLHPFFNLHKVITYRSSSDSPNFQNLPIRDSEIAKLLRTAFIPRPGHLIIENDFKGIEVCASVCYNLDPVLISYIKDPTKDMHRDCAMRLCLIDDPKIAATWGRTSSCSQASTGVTG